MLNKLSLVVIRGLPLSGKTTLGLALAKHLGIHYVDVDAIRHVAVGKPDLAPYASPERRQRDREDMVLSYRIMHITAAANLAAERSLVISATYSREAYQQGLLEAVAAAGAPVDLKGLRLVFNDTEEEVARRIADRDFGVGGCNAVSHYFDDRARYQKVSLFPFYKIDTSAAREEVLALALSYVGNN